MISVRRTNGLPQASFRFHFTVDTLAILTMRFPLTGTLRTFTFKNNVRAGRTEQDIEQSMSRVGHCIDNGPTEGLWGIIKSEMYCMYKITDEVSLRSAINKYIKFYAEERLQERFHCKTPLEVRSEALSAETPTQYPIAENKRIEAYKAKWCA